MKELKDDGYKIIYLDECMMAWQSITMTDYTNLNYKHRIPLTQLNHTAYALVFAISLEEGLEHYGIYKTPFRQDSFIDYLENLCIANKHTKIAVMMDNASNHKTEAVNLKMAELGIPSIYNVPYQPDLNPTEACFSKLKNFYKRNRLNKLVNEEELDVKALIE